MENLYETVYILASRGDVNGLMYLWAPTPWMEERGLIIRAAINSIVSSLAEQYKIKIEKGLDFPEFVKEYDEQTYNRECNENPNDCLAKFAREGDLRKIRTAINKGADDWDRGMAAAARGGHFDIVKFFADKGANNWNWGMKKAARGEYFDIVKFFVDKGANDWNWGMKKAARGGHLDIVKFFIDKGANNWDRGMAAAAEGGHFDIVKFFIDKGADVNMLTKNIREKLNL